MAGMKRRNVTSVRDMKSDRDEKIETGMMVGAAALDAGSGTPVASILTGPFVAWRRRRWEERVREAARIALGEDASPEEVASHLDLLCSTDAGGALLQALLLELESKKNWAYAALMGAFVGGDLTSDTKERFLLFCQDATCAELLAVVRYGLAVERDVDGALDYELGRGSLIDRLIRFGLYDSSLAIPNGGGEEGLETSYPAEGFTPEFVGLAEILRSASPDGDK